MRYFSDEETYSRIRKLKGYRELLSAPLPDHLFHYTSPPGLLGIVSSNSFWMSDTKSMNDEKELVYFKDIVKLVARNLRTDNSNDGFFAKHRQTLERFENYSLETDGGVFLLSLTEHRDQLSQWRAYSDGSRGFSFGVPTQRLPYVSAEKNHILVKCCYDKATAHTFATAILEGFLSEFIEGDLARTRDEIVQHEFAKVVNIIAPIFKHPSFAEEAEWRIYTYASWHDTRLEFRASRDEIIPFMNFPIDKLATDNEHRKRDHFIVIPGPGHRYNPTGGLGAFWKHLGARARVERSSIPYRAKE